MKRRLGMACILILLLILITGCWSRRELNELGIVVGMGIDKSGDQYLVSFQVVDPGEVAAKQGATGRAPVVMYKEESDTLFEAIRKITTISPRRSYFSHLRILVIGEELAKEGIGKSLEMIFRDHEFRTDFYIVVTKATKAEDVLRVITPLEKIPANHLFYSLQASEQTWAPMTTTVTLDQLISDIVSEGKHPVLTGLQVQGDKKAAETKDNAEEIESPGHLQYVQLAAFKKDRLVGWLNVEESGAYNYIQNNVHNTVHQVPCSKGGKAVVELLRSQTNLKGGVTNGKPQIDVNIQAEGNVAEVGCGNLDLSKPETIDELETEINQSIKDSIEASIEKVQERVKADIFGFGEAIRRSDPQAWKELKGDWDQAFQDLPVTVKVDVKIRRVGTVGETFLSELKE
ncbi:Ger(x)C family spore germination protein [Ammoniphilus sp. YIM 78166]|uniref:Ger(x)C family spore germination protein n=1 Tax=Ammoniphilus sp. YIM 78166 TaxID=1644106 RepID=UPI001F117AC9|nr:Ger(x)C family spore germination protein [Ammoniphilus sp. YIM 78166]